MTRKLTFLILALFALISGPGWGQNRTEYAELFTIKSADVVSGTTYKAHSAIVDDRGWIITFGGNNKSVGTNSGSRSNCKLSSYPKYAVSPVTTSDVASAFVNTTPISDVSKISYTFNGGSNQTNTNVYLIYSADGNTFSQMSLTSGTQGATISSGTAYEFAKCSGYFGLLFKATNSSGNWRIDDVNITFYKASTPSTDPVINVESTEVNLAYDETSATIGFSITNPVDNTRLDLSTQCDWIDGFVINANDFRFTAAVNNSSSSRTAVITVSYQGAESKTVTVNQAVDPSLIPTYTLVTDASTLAVGDIIVIGCSSEGKAAGAMGENNYFQSVEATVSNGTLTSTDADAIEITLGGSAGAWTLTTSEGQITTSAAKALILDDGTQKTWEISITSNGVATITGGSYGSIQYNASSPRFLNYTSSQTAIEIYKKEGTTPPTTYNITFTTNGISETAATIIVNQNDAIGELPQPTATNIPNGFVFKGWSTSEVALTNVEPTYITAGTVPEGNMTLHAVFAMAETVEEVDQKTFVLTKDDFNGTSYDANNGSHTKDGITYTSNQVMQQSNVMQWQKNAGCIYNETAMKVTSISITKTDGTFTVYEGSEKHPTETEANVSENTYTFNDNSNEYFTIKVGSETGKASNITVNYIGTISSTVYSNYCTSVTALSGTIADQTYVGAYYIKATEAGKPAQINCTVTINGALGNADPTLLIIENGGQLICNNAVKATVQKTIAGHYGEDATGGWNFIASPINGGSAVSTVQTTESAYDLYRFNQAADLEWENVKNSEHDFEMLANGQGYLYANDANTTLEFAGTLYNGDGKINLTFADKDNLNNTPSWQGWNLVGNPFTFKAYPSLPYYAMNTEGTAINAKTPNGQIDPCTSVFVQATATDQKVTFSKDAPARSGSLEISLAQANTRSASRIDNAIVSFGEGQQLEKLYMFGDGSSLYIPQGDKEYAIVSAATEGSLPLCFVANKNGTYTITVNTENIDAEYLHLIDNMTGMDIDVLATPSYTFEAKTSDYASRFKLVFNVNNAASASSANDFAYMSDGNLVISNIEGEATLQIVDMMGRVLSTETVSGNYNKALNLRAGVYVLNLNGMTQKIVVK